MKRPLVYVTAAWGDDHVENAKNAAKYCRALYEVGYFPICPILFLPLFLHDEIPREHKDGQEMAKAFLCRAQVLVVCGEETSEGVKNDIAMAQRLWITTTTLDGVLAIKKRGRVSANEK